MFDNGYDGPSILKPQGDIARMLEATSATDFALFVIALGRKEREEKAATELSASSNAWAQRY
jgi:hypothetical protein